MRKKNRGAISNPEGRFEKTTHEMYEDGWYREEENNLPQVETIFIPEPARSIISRNDSPDIGFDQSINPYQGCEHGCIYCYARPTHEYKGLSSGLEFETKIFYKENAANLLEKELNKSRYQCKPITLGANTDPYQPIESKLKITRSILDVLNRYNHPVTIITKNSLIKRDIDILIKMANRNLINVAVSITTLSNELKQKLEPRTSMPQARLKIISTLSENGIPVRVMAAPIIPLINDKELEKILSAASNEGALFASYVLIRLPHKVKELFKEWLDVHYPDKAAHVMSIIKQMRRGKEYDATFGSRMRGEGEFAQLLAARFKIACKRYKLNEKKSASLDTTSFKPVSTNDLQQLDFFNQLDEFS